MEEDRFFKEICDDMEQRAKTWPNSFAASPDEVRICYLICMVEELLLEVQKRGEL